MILVIARKELKEMFRDGRLFWSACLFIVLFAAAAISGWQKQNALSAERDRAQEIVYNQWLNQDEKNPHAAAHYGIYVFKDTGPLSFFDSGVNNYTGVSLWLEAHKQNRAKDRPASDMTSVQRFGDLTAAFVLQMLLPLIAIILAFDAFAGERERGTLRQLVSIGVKPSKLLIGKGLALSAALGLSLIPILLLAVFFLVSEGGSQILPRALLLVLVYGLYALIFLCLSLAVSARSKTPQRALVTLLAFWLVSSFLIPRLGTEFSRQIHPIPNAIAFADSVEADMENGLDGTSQSQRLKELREKTLERYQVSAVEELPLNLEGLSFILMEQMGDAVFDKHFGGLQDSFAKQVGVLQGFALVSPLSALTQVSSNLAGTSLTDHYHFANSAEQFRRSFVRTMNEDLAYNSKSGNTEYRAGPELWSVVSSFDYTPRTVIETVKSIGPSLIVLMIWAIVCLVAARLAVRRLSFGGGV